MKNIKTYEEFRITFKKYLNDNFFDVLNTTKIDCAEFRLIDLDGIEIFINLEMFGSYNNQITSLEPLKNLTKLRYICCADNRITSLKPILNLTKLDTLYCNTNPIDWVDYIDKDGRIYYIKLPKSIEMLYSDKFSTIEEYWEFMDKKQPAGISRKFNF